ncbi:MAG: PQQ-binding-like beta-propeller repeat protein, partial [Candidatus Poribacteria bacterium]|nr:PQQ-binding-like beta-propeller repeat protein [Candidatus Poribacteria bacterium]
VAFSSDGTHWHTATHLEGTPIVIERFAVDGTTVYGTSEQRVYQLNENSGIWQQIAPEIPMPITSLTVDGNVLYVGTDGSGVLRFRLDASE